MKRKIKESFLDLSKLDLVELKEIERQRWNDYRKAETQLSKLPESKIVQELNISWSEVWNLVQAIEEVENAKEKFDKLKKESEQKQNNGGIKNG